MRGWLDGGRDVTECNAVGASVGSLLDDIV